MAEQGRIKWFNNRAGWGFISRPGGPDVYVRHDRVVGEGFKVLHEGDLVEYVLRKGHQGPYAADVVIKENGSRAQKASGV